MTARPLTLGVGDKIEMKLISDRIRIDPFTFYTLLPADAYRCLVSVVSKRSSHTSTSTE